MKQLESELFRSYFSNSGGNPCADYRRLLRMALYFTQCERVTKVPISSCR